MIIEQQSGNKVVGFYRGIVKKHLSHGRCKIYIPSVYDKEYENQPDSLPSAQPATPLFAGTNEGNGCFSYPNLSSIVWCFFANDDVNYPVYFAAALGGEDAYGQYDIIKHTTTKVNGKEQKLEDVSTRHLITSGKTHIEWYENGKISAIVEDPIRTQCNTKYTDYEKSSDNISADYKNELSNYNISAIQINKLSNIDCQLVLDNNANRHGELSTSTHWYNIVDSNKDNIVKKGTISTDNRNIMNNYGIIDIGTISVLNMSENNSDSGESSLQKNYVNNQYKLYVPGYLNEHVQLTSTSDMNKTKSGLIDKLILSSQSGRIMDVNANNCISSIVNKKINKIDAQAGESINLTSDLTNLFSMSDQGYLDHILEYNKNVLSTSLDGAYTENKKSKAELTINTAQNTDIITKNDHTLIDAQHGRTVISSLENAYLMHDDGSIQSYTKKHQNIADVNTSTTITEIAHGKNNFDTAGNFIDETKYYNLTTINSNTTIENDNNTSFNMTSKEDATITLQSTGLKKLNGSSTVDTKYSNIVNTTTSIANIQIIDNLAKIECIDNMNAKAGNIEIHVKNMNANTYCTILMDAAGKMQITTTDSLTITTDNSVTVNTQSTTVNTNTTAINSPGGVKIVGDTDITGTLHTTGAVTFDSSAIVASDATIGGKSFLGHMHIGNMGAPTTPPI